MSKAKFEKTVEKVEKKKNEIKNVGEKIVGDMNSLKKQLAKLEFSDKLDDETRDKIQKRIEQAQGKVENKFSKDVEKKASQLEDEYDKLMSEAEDKRKAADDTFNEIGEISFEHMSDDLLSDAAKDAKDSVLQWSDQLNDTKNKKENMNKEIEALRKQLGE